MASEARFQKWNASADGITLELPECALGIGRVITASQTPDLIAGVEVAGRVVARRPWLLPGDSPVRARSGGDQVLARQIATDVGQLPVEPGYSEAILLKVLKD